MFVFPMFVCTLGKCSKKYFSIMCLEQRKTKQNPKPPEMGTMTANPPRNPPQTPPATTIRRPQQPTADHISSSKPQQQTHKSILQPNPTITHKTKNKSTKSTYHIWLAFKLHRDPTPPQPPRAYATTTTVTHYDHHEHQIPRTQKKKKKKKKKKKPKTYEQTPPRATLPQPLCRSPRPSPDLV
jgi:hypothetical protein